MKPKDKTAEQIGRFREVARELGADESEEAFKAKLRVIARQKPREEEAQPPKKKGRSGDR